MTKQQLGLLVAYIDAAIEKERAAQRCTDGGDNRHFAAACNLKNDIFNRLASSCDETEPNILGPSR